MPAWQSSKARWAASSPCVTEIIERKGHVSPAAAGNVGRRESAALNFTTGLRICQASNRSWYGAGTAPEPSSMPSARFGSALHTTVRARSSSPPARRTPSPGRISATSTPQASAAPASAAASARAKLIMPMPPRT